LSSTSCSAGGKEGESSGVYYDSITSLSTGGSQTSGGLSGLNSYSNDDRSDGPFLYRTGSFGLGGSCKNDQGSVDNYGGGKSSFTVSSSAVVSCCSSMVYMITFLLDMTDQIT
jgi:hypothetical protein